MTDREIMEQALEALDLLSRVPKAKRDYADRAIAALRERLAQPEQCQYPDCKCATENPCLKGLAQPEQEPVACIGTNGELMWLNKPRVIYSKPQPLFTTPPQRTWVGLTDEEKAELDAEYGDDTLAHLDAIEAKLKEKNNG